MRVKQIYEIRKDNKFPFFSNFYLNINTFDTDRKQFKKKTFLEVLSPVLALWMLHCCEVSVKKYIIMNYETPYRKYKGSNVPCSAFYKAQIFVKLNEFDFLRKSLKLKYKWVFAKFVQLFLNLKDF